MANGRWRRWRAVWLALACSGCVMQSGGGELLEVGAETQALKVTPLAAPPPTTTTTTITTTPPTTGTGFLGTLPAVGFMPAHGSTLYGSEPWYDATIGANGAIEIQGSASYLPAAAVNAGNVAVQINGVYGTTITSSNVGPRGGEVRFEGIVPAFIDPAWVQREISVSVFNTATQRVYARATNIIYDLRREASASPYAEPGAIDGMAVHFMPSGIGDSVIDDWTVALETPHLASLPLDGLSAFNAQLGNAVRGAVMDGVPINVCFNLDEADDAFRAFPQYVEVFAEAAALYAVYEAWERGGQEACHAAIAAATAPMPALGFLLGILCDTAMSNWCVKELPRMEDFEICFERLDGDPEDLTIQAVSDVQLTWDSSTAGAAVNAQVALGGIEGTLDGLLRAATLRWAEDKCDGRPSVDVPDSAFAGNKGAAAAASCPDMQLVADLATTTAETGASFLARGAAHDGEQVDVSQTADPSFGLVEPDSESREGLCEDLRLWSAADALVLSFQAEVEDALTSTWNIGDQQAQALEHLLERLELGLTAHDRYDLAAELRALRSDSDGADIIFETEVDSTSLPPVLDPRQYYHPAHPAPFTRDGTDPQELDDAVDMTFTVNTGFLNQIISRQGKTDLLTFEYAPAWDEVTQRFGATPANTGHPSDQEPPLDGAVLSRLHPAFAELGARRVEIFIRPTLDPLAWMNPDPPWPQHDADLAFGIGGMEVVLTEPAQIDPATGKEVPGLTWLTARYGLREPQFALGIEDGSNVLEIPPELSTSYVSILSTRFTGCPMVRSSSGSSCEAGLVDALDALMHSLIEPRMLSMLTAIPVPNVWDASGETTAPVELRLLDQVQMNQNITFVVDIEDGDY